MNVLKVIHKDGIVAQRPVVVALLLLAGCNPATAHPPQLDYGRSRQLILPLAPSGWPETKHRWANPKAPYEEVYLPAFAIRQVGATKEALWAGLKKFKVGNPSVNFNGDWHFGGKGSGFALTYEFGFRGDRVERVYIETSETSPSGLITPSSFSWPKEVKAYTAEREIESAIEHAKKPGRKPSNEGGWFDTRLCYVLEAKLPNGSIMRHLAYAGDAIGQWITYREEFNASRSRTELTWQWRQPLRMSSTEGTTRILVATPSWWHDAETGGNDSWGVRSFYLLCGAEKLPMPFKVAVK